MKFFLRIAVSLTAAFSWTVYASEPVKAAAPLTGKDVETLLSQYRTVGQMMEIVRLIFPAEDYDQILNHLTAQGIKKSDSMPKIAFKKSKILIEGDKREFEFAGISRGEISDGHQVWRFDQRKSGVDNFKKLAALFQPQKKTTLLDLLIPRANAQAQSLAEALAPSVVALGGLVGAASLGFVSIGILKFVAALSPGGAAAPGTIFALSGATIVGAAAVLAIIAEIIVKNGLRMVDSTSINCENGQITVKDSTGRTYTETWSLGSHISLIEWAYFKAFCREPRAKEKLQSLRLGAVREQKKDPSEGVR